MDTLDAALRYAERGWSVIPVAAGKKTPAVSWERYTSERAGEGQLRDWFANGSKLGVGIVTGQISSLVVLDTDTTDAETWVRSQNLPETLKVKTSAGWHRYFRLGPGQFVRNSAGLLYPGVDTRGEGGFVVAPPTVHPSGRTYLWAPVHAFADWSLKLPERKRAMEVGETIPNSARNDTLTSIAGSMRRRGSSEAAIFAALKVENDERCETPLDEAEVRKIAHSVAGYEPQDPPTVELVPERKGLPWHIVGPVEENSEVESIVDQVIFRGGKTLLLSLPKAGKSYLALAMSGAIRNQKKFLGFATEPARILYLTEEGMGTFLSKVERFQLPPFDPDFRFIRRSEADVSAMSWPDIVKNLVDTSLESSVDLIFIDVLHRWARFEEGQENDSAVVSKAIGALDPLTEAGIAVVVLHHSPWSAKRSRGSTDISGSVDTLLFIDGSGADARTLENLGGRYDSDFSRVSFRIGEDGLLESLGKERTSSASKIAQLMSVIEVRGPSSSEDIASDLDWNERTVQRWAMRAYDHQLIGREITESGRFVWRKRQRFEHFGEV